MFEYKVDEWKENTWILTSESPQWLRCCCSLTMNIVQHFTIFLFFCKQNGKSKPVRISSIFNSIPSYCMNGFGLIHCCEKREANIFKCVFCNHCFTRRAAWELKKVVLFLPKKDSVQRVGEKTFFRMFCGSFYVFLFNSSRLSKSVKVYFLSDSIQIHPKVKKIIHGNYKNSFLNISVTMRYEWKYIIYCLVLKKTIVYENFIRAILSENVQNTHKKKKKGYPKQIHFDHQSNKTLLTCVFYQWPFNWLTPSPISICAFAVPSILYVKSVLAAHMYLYKYLYLILTVAIFHTHLMCVPAYAFRLNAKIEFS